MPSDDLRYQLGLLSFIRPEVLLRQTRRLPSIWWRRLPRVGAIAAGGAAGTPLRLAARGRAKDLPEPSEAPVFIIGHWRSGTTHLHNLMANDPQFAALRMYQALAPDAAATSIGWLESALGRVMPLQRPMDAMVWPMTAPQEEEIPLAKLTPNSWYTQFLFPQDAVATFERCVLAANPGGDQRVRAEIETHLRRLYAVASARDGGRPLLSKNPVHTARVGLLRAMYPQARFVFIHRDPYEVFASTMNLHRRILRLTALQRYDDADIEANVLALYRLVMTQYLDDIHAVPAAQRMEVAYADLDRDPANVVARIYDRLDIGGHDNAAAAISAYVETQVGYRKNRFAPISQRLVERIDRAWGFAFDRWGYERRGGAERVIELRDGQAASAANAG